MSLQQQFYEMLMESQWWSAEQLRDYQRSQLSQLLRHAKKNVPFYEHRLDAVLKPNGDIDWDRWSEIPIVKRQDMIDHREAMQAKELPPGHGPTSTTSSSGSTGRAVTVTMNGLVRLVGEALHWRVHRWHDIGWERQWATRMGRIDGPIDWPQGTPIGPWGPPWDTVAQRGFGWSLNSKVPNDALLKFLGSHGCSYLTTGPKSAHLLALESQRLDAPLHIAAMLVHSGAIGEDDRAICAAVFGSTLIEHYSSKEGGQMAHACPQGSLHLCGETNLVEIVDPDGRPTPVGIPGRVVITPFFSTAQPLIRYEQGDIAAMGEPCRCGICLPVLKEILGRTLAIFRHPDGRTAVRILPDSARDFLECEFWQIAQVGPNDYEVRYVPRERSKKRNEVGFVELFRSVYFDDASVTFKRLNHISLTPSGKLLEYVNEWRTPTKTTHV